MNSPRVSQEGPLGWEGPLGGSVPLGVCAEGGSLPWEDGPQKEQATVAVMGTWVAVGWAPAWAAVGSSGSVARAGERSQGSG